MLNAAAFPNPGKQELIPHQMDCSGLLAFFLSLSLLLRCSAAQQPNTDAYLVAAFFQSMGGVLPPSSATQFCSWSIVTCDTQMEKVTSLVAPSLGLSGPIPVSTIGKLSELRFLDLSGNNITAFSSDFWELGGSLRHLNVSYNRITGPLPSNIGNFGKMESLDLSYNDLSGEVPVEVGSLSNLKALNLRGNSFEGSIPSAILGCKSLVSMSLSGNMLNGSVPDGFGTAFSNLTFLDLSDNAISGRLPDLSGLESVTYLNLSGNMLQDSVIGVFRNPLEVVDLSKNHISQVNLSSNASWSTLLYLDMSTNELSGEFFSYLGGARMLKHLNLADNKFALQGFPMIGMLSELEYLNMSKTGITGEITSDISQLVGLKVLDLSQNHLNGSIPELSIGALQVIDLSVNNLTGEIPLSLQKRLINMEKFNFSYNNLTLCAAKFPPLTLSSAFIGSQNDCPIAANPEIIQTRRLKHKNLKLAIAIVLSAFCLVTGLVCLFIVSRRRNRPWAVKQMSHKEEEAVSGPFSFQTDSTTWVADVKLATSVPVVIFEKPLLNFTFADLLSATSHFDRGTLLAEGRFGPVYRGFLPGGIHAAVKVLVHVSTVTDQEAARELERLGQIRHPNLVPLTGYCLAGDQRIAIYEYMENGNLQNLLHDLPSGVQATEDWSTDTWEEDNAGAWSITTEGMTTWRFRHKIALGAARALAFLHHGCFPQIVHRDVKASSIYLDSALEPRLSDFGLSTITNMDDDISRGSLGYAPPEFSEFEKALATTKSDVYGFGVVLFELITGKKPIGDEYPEEKETTLVNWARSLVKRNEGSRLIDPKIKETAAPKQIEEALRVAYLCTADLPSKRPSMQQIVGLLKDIEPSPSDH